MYGTPPTGRRPPNAAIEGTERSMRLLNIMVQEADPPVAEDKSVLISAQQALSEREVTNSRWPQKGPVPGWREKGG